MNPDQAQKWIVIATVVTLGSTGAAIIKKPEGKKAIKTHRAIAGGFFAMAFCSIIADVDAKAGVGLAALVAGGAFFTYGLPVLQESFETEAEKKAKKAPSNLSGQTPSTSQRVSV